MTLQLRLTIIVVLLALAVALSLWNIFHLPTSMDEALFRYRLSDKVTQGSKVIKLTELMGGEWEVVCESHGYNGPLYLKRYGRTYPPAAPPQEGVWGLVFIAKDGSPRYVVGSFKHGGANIDIPSGCAKRENTVLTSHGPPSSPTYSIDRSASGLTTSGSR